MCASLRTPAGRIFAMGTLAVLATAGALAPRRAARADGPAASGAAQLGDALPTDALPKDTLPVLGGYPAYAPDPDFVRDEAALVAWAERTAALAARTNDPALRSDLDLSAAQALRWVPEQSERCHALLRQGIALRPAHDPFGALARLALFDLALDVRVPPDWRTLGLEAWAYLKRPSPLDPTPALGTRDALARREIRARFPPLILRHALAEGDLEVAASWAWYMAAEPDPSWSEDDALRYERAAVLAFRTGRTRLARELASQALERAEDPAVVARLAFWRLHLDHRLLSSMGLLTPGTTPPGATFIADLEAVLRGLAGNPHVGGFLLSSASSALHAGAYAQALAIYRFALDDRELVARAWQNAGLWGGLLPAVKAAEALGRHDEAESILASVERLAGEPVGEADALRASIVLSRRRASAHADAPPPPPPAPQEPRAPPVRPRALGELALPRAPEPAEHASAPASRPADLRDDLRDEAPDEPLDGLGGVGWLSVAVGAALACLWFVWHRRRNPWRAR